ncbi:uncharacterized protein LOC119686225 [Teleopsis dalmanni]|uniref:uncharacterized protein LOC119686225 n=1 Tax=Teleopsis dalmanni TaxID=139649 RepID=UPI0018CEBB54|nr:uncharacterized protein LOC119686225 [Teleopsis dalmanni]
MPRTEPIHQLDAIGCLDKNTIKSVGEYFASKLNNKNFRKLPDEYEIDQSPDVFYLKCAREHNLLLQEQMERIAESKKLEILNVNREIELCKQQIKLREKFVEYSKILKEVKDKGEAAKVTIANEINDLESASAKVKFCKLHMDALKMFKTQFQKTVNDYEVYDDFMNDFIKSNPVYETPDHFIAGMDALLMAYVEMNDMNNGLEEKFIMMKNELMQTTREAASRVLRMKNELELFQRAYIVVRNEVQELEEKLKRSKHVVMQKDLENRMMEQGLYNLGEMLCKRRNISVEFRKNEVDKICKFIKTEVEVLRGTYNIIKHLEKDYKK